MADSAKAASAGSETKSRSSPARLGSTSTSFLKLCQAARRAPTPQKPYEVPRTSRPARPSPGRLVATFSDSI